MRIRVFSGLIFAFTIFLTLPVSGQQNPGPASLPAAARAGHALLVPYTAEFKSTTVQVLANGSTITSGSTKREVVDSQGRALESTTFDMHSPRGPFTNGMIYDPVRGYMLTWSSLDPEHKVKQTPLGGARRQPCAPSSAASSVAAAGGRVALSSPPRIQGRLAKEDLGTDRIFGIEVRGTRLTRTTPAGAIGNDQPLVHTTEMWQATEPGLTRLFVKTVSDDPQRGKTVEELVRFERGEPDSASFQPPEGYEVVVRTEKDRACPSAAAPEQPAPAQ